jgi:hypothetical protein
VSNHEIKSLNQTELTWAVVVGIKTREVESVRRQPKGTIQFIHDR